MGTTASPERGRRDGGRLSRAQEARLDAALAEYRDRTYAQWAAPAGFTAESPLGDLRIEAALRAAPAPTPPTLPARSRSARPRSAQGPSARRGPRLGLGVAAAAAVGAVAVTVAVSTVRDAPSAPTAPAAPGAEPETGVLLAAATPGGDRGAFADSAALQRCLDAASVPAGRRTLLGAGQMRVHGDPATVLLLPGGALGDVRVLAVAPSCARGEASAVLVNRVLPGGAAG